jgi:large subunit ribosomal protein L19
MQDTLAKIEKSSLKKKIADVRVGDTVRVHQKIKEGAKERIQIFEGVVVRTDRKNSHTSRITVRKIASGVGVEKGFFIHSPLVEKIEVVRRSKVRRNYLSYLRERSGKSARLKNQNFDREGVNDVRDLEAEAEEHRLKKQAKKDAATRAEEKAKEDAKLAALQAEVEARHTES